MLVGADVLEMASSYCEKCGWIHELEAVETFLSKVNFKLFLSFWRSFQRSVRESTGTGGSHAKGWAGRDVPDR